MVYICTRSKACGLGQTSLCTCLSVVMARPCNTTQPSMATALSVQAHDVGSPSPLCDATVDDQAKMIRQLTEEQ